MGFDSLFGSWVPHVLCLRIYLNFIGEVAQSVEQPHYVWPDKRRALVRVQPSPQTFDVSKSRLLWFIPDNTVGAADK